MSLHELRLLCPICAGHFEAHDAEGRLTCPSHHSFDTAKQGYLNLLTGKGTKLHSDTLEMARDRAAFLEASHYQALAEAVLQTLLRGLPQGTPIQPTRLLEVATGTGYYLNWVSQGLSAAGHAVEAAGFDLSKLALRRAARLNPAASVFVWDVWQKFPLADEGLDVILVIFAPRNAEEFARTLRPGGLLVVVTPQADHLDELAARDMVLGVEADKLDRLDATLASQFSLSERRELRFDMELTAADVVHLALMGPAGHHATDETRTDLLGQLENTLTMVTAAFTLSVFTAL